MEFLQVIVVVAFCLVAWSLLKRKGRKLPPGPLPLPIVGNIFQLGSGDIHESFAKLSKKYGPVMSINLGSVLTVVVSSPETAKEVLTKQTFLDRPMLEAFYSHDHYKFSIGYLPTSDPKWRDLRKICQEQMFATHNLERRQSLRHQKLQQLIDYVRTCSETGRAVNIRRAIFTTTLNLMSVTLFSSDATDFDSKITAELHEIIMGVVIAVSTRNYADYFPFLKPFDPQGVRREADLQYGRLLSYMKTRIDQRLEMRRGSANQSKPNDFLEKLLDIAEESEYNLGIRDMLHLLVDLYMGGSESTTVTTEWVMSKLLENPHALSKVKDELRNVLGDRKMISEGEDIARLPYLQGAVRETLRLHPPGPLLFPRKAIQDTEISGYFIPNGTQILVNAWNIANDPTVWPNPESFDPERYLKTNIDYKGQNFELVPFGSGRRICPGMQLAHRIVHAAVAALIHNFDWKFAPGESERNNARLLGSGLRREAPLMAIPLKI